MKRLILALLALLFATPAFGQAWQHPDWTDGSVPARDWTNYTLNDTIQPTTLPADAYEPPDISESIVDNDWIITVPASFYDSQVGVGRKFRTTCKPSTAKPADPILGFGIFPFGHRHQATGNMDWDQNSTWNTLRASPNSTCGGGPLNGTVYIEPEMLQPDPVTGAARGIRPAVQDFYYVVLSSSKVTWLRRGLKFILGVNPKNFNDAARRAELAGQPSTSSSKFLYPGGTETPSGFLGWQCFRPGGTPATVTSLGARKDNRGNPTSYARWLRGPNGEDPWGGTCSNNGVAGTSATIIGNLVAPDCWDGHNLTAPDGRDHFTYSATNGANTIQNACPSMMVNGVRQYYVKVPSFTVKTEFRTTGFEDYGTWYLASDRMRVPTIDCPDATVACDGVSGGNVGYTSLDTCRKVGIDYCNGSTLHADWTNGWKQTIIEEWERECLGITVHGVSPTNGPSECDGGTISRVRQIRSGGQSPNPALTGGCSVILGCNDTTPVTGAQRYNPLPEGPTGPFHVHGREHASWVPSNFDLRQRIWRVS